MHSNHNTNMGVKFHDRLPKGIRNPPKEKSKKPLQSFLLDKWFYPVTQYMDAYYNMVVRLDPLVFAISLFNVVQGSTESNGLCNLECAVNLLDYNRNS